MSSYRQTDKQTDIQTDKQTDIHTDKQRQAGRQADRWGVTDDWFAKITQQIQGKVYSTGAYFPIEIYITWPQC